MQRMGFTFHQLINDRHDVAVGVLDGVLPVSLCFFYDAIQIGLDKFPEHIRGQERTAVVAVVGAEDQRFHAGIGHQFVAKNNCICHGCGLFVESLRIVHRTVGKLVHLITIRNGKGTVPVECEHNLILCDLSQESHILQKIIRQSTLTIYHAKIAHTIQRNDGIIQLIVHIGGVFRHLIQFTLPLQRRQLFDPIRVQLRRNQGFAEHLLRQLKFQLKGRNAIGDL